MKLDQNHGHDAVGAHVHVSNVLNGKEASSWLYLKHVAGALQERISRMGGKLKRDKTVSCSSRQAPGLGTSL